MLIDIQGICLQVPETNNISCSQALKMRKHLSKQIEKLRADSTSGTDIAHFDAIDTTLGQ